MYDRVVAYRPAAKATYVPYVMARQLAETHALNEASSLQFCNIVNMKYT
jgi:hypothetical protein